MFLNPNYIQTFLVVKEIVLLQIELFSHLIDDMCGSTYGACRVHCLAGPHGSGYVRMGLVELGMVLLGLAAS